ncbi:S8 family serine peptidase [Bacillus sp. R86525]|uniref:S8 family peptidase n=1 Tax=Bacillus sp. R86525 TaxID=3101709 RepID=UPI0036726880
MFFRRIIAYLSLCFFLIVPFQNISVAESLNYYTILIDDPKHLAISQKMIYENNAQIIYSVDEIGLLQVKASPNDMKKIGYAPHVSTYNPSLRFYNHQNTIKDPENDILDDNPWDQQWDMKKVTHDGKSYEIFQGTKDVTVGIIDSGIDINHSDLKNNIVPGSKNLVPKGGFRGQESDENGNINFLEDKLGHGTFAAGQIAANGKIKGVAPGIGIKSYRIFGNGSGETAWVIKAIIEAAKDDVDVINLSLGEYLIDGSIVKEGQESVQDFAEIRAYKKAIDYAQSLGSVVVAAAGNDSLNVRDHHQMDEFYKKRLKNDDLIYKGTILDIPADLPGVVTVSSVNASDFISDFSNYGQGFIDISAPGGDLRLFNKYGFDIWIKDKLYLEEQVLGVATDNRYGFSCGTSIAAPKVSGALALIIDKYHFKNQPNSSINFLYKFGVNHQEGSTDLSGNGVLDVYKAMNR